jgi:hypothetical protein
MTIKRPVIGALHSNEDTNAKPKIRFCSRCEEGYGVLSRLGPKILGIGESRPADYDLFIQCHNCGTVYPKHETKVEPELEPLVKPSSGKGKIQGVEKKRKPKGRGYNPRLKGNKWEIKDEELKAELKSGAVVLLAYSSNDPTEPVV